MVCCRICRRVLNTPQGLTCHFTRRHRPRVAYPPVSARQDQFLPPGRPG